MVDGWMKIVIVTPELSIEKMAELLYAKKQWITDMDVDAKEEGKTPSERLRNVIYAVFKDRNVAELFDDYYRREMEDIINVYKRKLPPL